MFNRFYSFYLQDKPPVSSLHILKSSYIKNENPPTHPKIDKALIKENGFLCSDDEKENLLFYMAYHHAAHEKIPGQSPLNKTSGAVLINRNKHQIYKIYSIETQEQKSHRNDAIDQLNSFDGMFLAPLPPKPGALGQGGFGKVYPCQNLISGEWHAVKIIKKSLMGKLSYLIGLPHYETIEIKVLKEEKLFIDLIDSEDKIYIIEKLIHGKNVVEHLKDKLTLYSPNDSKSFVNLFFELVKKMAISLYELHQKNYIHNDICPDHFLYDENHNKLQLIDFGLSIKASPNTYAYREAIFGKIGFIAPETLKRQLYSSASDIYALSICFDMMYQELVYAMKTRHEFNVAFSNLILKMQSEDFTLRPKLLVIIQEIQTIKENALNELTNAPLEASEHSQKMNLNANDLKTSLRRAMTLFSESDLKQEITKIKQELSSLDDNDEQDNKQESRPGRAT